MTMDLTARCRARRQPPPGGAFSQRLLVSVRGPREALSAARGGAHIADVEYPGSALGTPYPLNIRAVRNALDQAGFKSTPVSTNIGERQDDRATACQAALGVAASGATIVKFGLAYLPVGPASYLGRNLVRTLRRWHPDCQIIASVFADPELRRFFEPVQQGVELVVGTAADGLLVDTLRKDLGKGLTDYIRLSALADLANRLHAEHRQLWLAGSIAREEFPRIWSSQADVICVRAAACRPLGKSGLRFGSVARELVEQIVRSIPAR